MSTQNYDQSKLNTIKTYILIAFIFSIIFMIAWILEAVYNIWVYINFSSIFFFGGFAGIFLIYTVVFLVLFVLALLVFMRIRRMYTAVNSGDIATLKQLNNMMWAIIALIFAGVIPGVMLIISVGPINELGQSPMTQQAGAYPPPPPPPPPA